MILNRARHCSDDGAPRDDTSLRRRARFAHYHAPFLELALHELAELVRRAARWIGAFLDHRRLDGGYSDDRVDLLVQRGDHLRRRTLGAEEAEPGARLEAWVAALC